MRYDGMSAELSDEQAPVAEFGKLGNLREYMPADEPIVSAEQRTGRCWMNHYGLLAVMTLRASALCASFQIACAICRTGWFSPQRLII